MTHSKPSRKPQGNPGRAQHTHLPRNRETLYSEPTPRPPSFSTLVRAINDAYKKVEGLERNYDAWAKTLVDNVENSQRDMSEILVQAEERAAKAEKHAEQAERQSNGSIVNPD
ncbi:hypothetical protein H2201_008705 [Coniosporium apollinis]|uniref:Uncharacterized protein n=1 Tax=Coniosporium apollinis TaxID=61459 RepID=A0ABQ9NGC6_9PEZI|nr:hypothetical protein H2201_008705 [Coniosporium apollinis]